MIWFVVELTDGDMRRWDAISFFSLNYRTLYSLSRSMQTGIILVIMALTREQAISKAEELVPLSGPVYNAARLQIIRALEESKWNKSKAAEILQVNRKMIYDYILKYDIQEPDKSIKAA